MAAIYGNNFHEKLVSVAISKEHLKYNTPFCDLVDDPAWAVDINLALDYYSATTGNLDAADRAVQSLTLYSGIFDGSTIDFYVLKMAMNPAFKSAIYNMNHRWTNPTDFDDDFQSILNQAIKDCLNSPCNLFTETSDSIGRMAQSASTSTSGNTFGFGALSASFTNMIDGLDQTIFNKIPAIFQNAFVEVAQVANKAFANTQAVLAGKKNLTTFNTNVANGKSFRSPSDMFRYTPDVKSNYDYSAASSNVLSKIKEDTGGCFNKYEYKYRYNPYENNLSRPLGTKTSQVNGHEYDTAPDGKPDRSPNNSERAKRQTNSSSSSNTDSTTTGESFMNGDVKISSTYTLESKGGSGRSHYSIFASLIDVEEKTLWYETYDKLPDDVKTLQGIGNNGTDYRIGISVQGTNPDFEKRALNGDKVTDEEVKRFGTITQAGSYAAKFKHDLTDAGMEKYSNTTTTKIINDGVAISKSLFKKFLNEPGLSFKNLSYKKPQQANEFFVAARPAGSPSMWKLYKVVDTNGQADSNIDFTVGAYKHFIKSFNPNGLKDITAMEEGPFSKRSIEGTKWSKVHKGFHEPLGNMEVKLCMGNIDDLKAQLGGSKFVSKSAAVGKTTDKENEAAKKAKINDLLDAQRKRDGDDVESPVGSIEGWPFRKDGSYDESLISGTGTASDDPRFEVGD